MLRFARLLTVPAKPTLTIFHNTNSKISRHLLGRLAKHDSRYLLDLRVNKLPLYRTYHFIHEECMNVHPQNARGFEKIFPALLSKDHLFCDVEVKKSAKQKQFVPDMDLVSENSYLDKVAHHTPDELAPFVVDWANQLVAVDDEGLDRIMANYYSCGMQGSSVKHEHIGPDIEKSEPSEVPLRLRKFAGSSRSQAAAMVYAVHPHVAEFADLF